MAPPSEPASLAESWARLADLLEASPLVRRSLEPPASAEDLNQWSDAIGAPLPRQLVDLYQMCGGTKDFPGHSGFTLLARWRLLPVQEAIKAYPQRAQMARMWGVDPQVPFARDYSGGFLVVPLVGTPVSLFFEDTPPMRIHDSIAEFVRVTVEALQGRYDRFRPQLSANGLQWIDTEEEEDFLDEMGAHHDGKTSTDSDLRARGDDRGDQRLERWSIGRSNASGSECEHMHRDTAKSH